MAEKERANGTSSSPGAGEEERDDEYRILVEFAVRHLNFQMAELESVLDMHGIRVDAAARPQHQQRSEGATTTARLIPLHENPAVAHHFRCRRSFVVMSLPYDSPFIPTSAQRPTIAAAEDTKAGEDEETEEKDIASIILSRCTLVRSVMELWGVGTTPKDCAASAINWTQTTTGQTIHQNVSNQSWKLTVHTVGTKFTRNEQNLTRQEFRGLDFSGPVQMEDPTNEFVFIRECALEDTATKKQKTNCYATEKCFVQSPSCTETSTHPPPLACYFGRALAGCRRVRRMGGKIHTYSLKQRRYLGPTSMDAELSFIMSNLGQVRPGTMVLDPFVGTGSIVLSCALQGAYCVGTDIDIRVLRGRSADENIVANFQQYNLPRPELIRSDNGIYHRHFQTQHCMYDAILCDPPYGIRAGARKTGSKKEQVGDILPENRHDHIAQTQPYAVSDVMADLLDVAARSLVPGGRLVYIIPSFATDFDAEKDLPQHPCLKIVHACYQPFTLALGRRMVVMKKVCDYDPAQRDAYLVNIWKNGPESAEKCANIRGKILEAAKNKPNYEEKAAIRRAKRIKHREEKKAAKKRAKLDADVSNSVGREEIL
jgi:tRNA (guanine10-N2)-methyltransferase